MKGIFIELVSSSRGNVSAQVDLKSPTKGLRIRSHDKAIFSIHSHNETQKAEHESH